MRGPWGGVIAAAVGLVLSALCWWFAVSSASTSVLDGTTVCVNRWGWEVPCSILGVDMSVGGLLALVLLLGSIALAGAAVWASQEASRRSADRWWTRDI